MKITKEDVDHIRDMTGCNGNTAVLSIKYFGSVAAAVYAINGGKYVSETDVAIKLLTDRVTELENIVKGLQK